MKGGLLGQKRGNGRLINLESAVSTSKTREIWHSTRGARNPARSRRRTLQNVHTHVKLCPPPGRKRVVSYHHSQGTTKLQGQGPGTGGETAVRACSVGTAAFAYCPPAVGADKQHHASRVLKIEGIKKRPGAGTSSGPLCLTEFAPPARKNGKSVFPVDMCLGENTAQAPSVETAAKGGCLCAQGAAILFHKAAKPLCGRSVSP